MSSLQDQLRARGNTQVRSLHVRYSLLFDGKEAARIDSQAIQLLGVDGFNQLLKVEPRLKAFDGVLISATQSLSDFNRSMQTKEANAKLDENIAKFMRLIGPYILLPATHKMLEYLIRAYRINEFNVDAVLLAMLPFHETNVFVRMLQIINVKDTEWKFLGTCKKNGVAPSRQLLVNQMRMSRWFRTSVCELPKLAVENQINHKSLHSFYAALMVSLLTTAPVDANGASAISDLVTDVFEHLVNGFKSLDPDYQLATCLIVSALAQGFGNFKLDEKLSRRIIALACQYSTPTVRYTSLLSILLVLQRSGTASTYIPSKNTLLSINACVGLQSWNDLTAQITRLANSKFDLAPLLGPFLSDLFSGITSGPSGDAEEAPKETLMDLARELIAGLPTHALSPQVASVTKLAISNFTKNHKIVPKEIALKLRAILASLDTKFPAEFDEAVDALCKIDANSEHSVVSKSSWEFLFDNTRHQSLKIDKSILASTVSFVPTTLKHSLSPSAPSGVITQALEVVFANRSNASDADIAKTFDILIKSSVSELVTNPNSPHSALVYLLQRNEASTMLENFEAEKLLKIFSNTWIPRALNLAKDSDASLLKAIFTFLSGPFVAKKADLTEESLVLLLSVATTPSLEKGAIEVFAEAFKAFPHALIANFSAKQTKTQIALLARLVSTLRDNVLSHSKVLGSVILRLLTTRFSFLEASARVRVSSLLFLALVSAVKTKTDDSTAKILLDALSRNISQFLGSPNPTVFAESPSEINDLAKIDGLPKFKAEDYSAFLASPKPSIFAIFAPAVSALIDTVKNSENPSSSELIRPLMIVLTAADVTQWPKSEADKIKPVVAELNSSLYSALSPSSLPTFLASIWCASPAEIPVLGQLRALSLFSGILSSHLESSDLTSLLRFFPHVLVALTSSDRALRDLALKVLDVMKTPFANAIKSGASVLGESKPTAQQLHRFVKSVLSQRELFLVDANNLELLLKTILDMNENDDDGDKDFMYVEDREAIAQFLVSEALKLPHLFGTYNLLRSLRDVVTASKVEPFVQFITTHAGQLALAETTLEMPTDRYLAMVIDEIIRQLVASFTVALSKSKSDLEIHSSALAIVLSVLRTRKSKTYDAIDGLEAFEFSPARHLLTILNGNRGIFFYQALSSVRQHVLFASMCKLVPILPPDLQILLRNALVHLPITPNNVVQALSAPPLIEADKSEPVTKKARGRPKKNSDLASYDWILLTVLLEIYNQKPTILDVSMHVPILFSHLTKLVELADSSNEYLLQLLLDSLATLTHRLRPVPLSAEDSESALAIAYRNEMKSVVDCLRVFTSPIVHHSALSFLAEAASRFPAEVLAHVMELIGYLGIATRSQSGEGEGAVLRDDQYSFLVLQRALEAIVPPLLKGGDLGVRALLKELVGALTEVPEHRRLLICSTLLTVLDGSGNSPGDEAVASNPNAGIYLAPVLTLLFDKAANNKVGRFGVEEALSFAHELVKKFHPFSVMRALSVIADSISSKSDESEDDDEDESEEREDEDKMDEDESEVDEGPEAATNHFVSEMKSTRPLHALFFEYLSQLLASRGFLSQLAHVTGPDENRLQACYLSLFQNTLLHLQTLAKISSENAEGKEEDNEDDEEDDEAIKTESKSAESALSSLNQLLALTDFLTVIASLLHHKDALVQRRSLTLLKSKLEALTTMPPLNLVIQFVALTKSLSEILSAPLPSTGRRDAILTQQTAAIGIEVLSRAFAKVAQVTQTFVDLIPPLLNVLTRLPSNNAAEATEESEISAELQASCMIAIATVTKEIGAKVLPHLNRIAPAVIGFLTARTLGSTPNDIRMAKLQTLLQLASLKSLDVMFASVGQFLTPHTSRILIAVLTPALIGSSQTREQIRSLLKVFSTHLGARHLIGPAGAAYLHITNEIKKSENAADWIAPLIELIEAVGNSCDSLDAKDVPTQNVGLFKFFLRTFGFRSEFASLWKKKESFKLVGEVEAASLAAFERLVMKLNEKLFRPLFLQLIDWAQLQQELSSIDPASLKEVADAKDIEDANAMAKSLTFYRALTDLADNLKGIMVPYFNNVLEHIVVILQLPPPVSNPKTRSFTAFFERLAWILRALTNVLLYDPGPSAPTTAVKLMTTELYDRLLPVFVNLVSRFNGETNQFYEDRVDNVVKPLILQLAVTVNNEALWKPLNYQIFMLTRSEDASVRYAALDVIGALYERLGEGYLPLLPESMQFISELTEDPDPRVEGLTSSLLVKLERLLGDEESLRDLLKEEYSCYSVASSLTTGAGRLISDLDGPRRSFV